MTRSRITVSIMAFTLLGRNSAWASVQGQIHYLGTLRDGQGVWKTHFRDMNRSN